MSAALVSHGYDESTAKILATNCVTAHRDGSESHGLFRLKDYIATIKSGYVNGSPRPKIEDVSPGLVRVDADNGFAQIALERAEDIMVAKARTSGVAVLAIRNSHHTGALYIDVERFAEKGFLAIAVVNSIAVVAPPGGNKGVYGTNPIAFAAPRASTAPLVFDLASSTMSHGDVQVAAREGRLLPEDTGIDKNGKPTGSPHAILSGGALSTFGGHKGASIALMVEILCAGLVGADFSFEVDRGKPLGATTARTGETIIVIDPNVGAKDLPPLARRVDDLVEALSEAGQGRIPGDRRIRARREAGKDVFIHEDQWTALNELAAPIKREA
ncbi:Ldh family oxidoreductase (plasmid) [Rhizobium leguminosarum]